MLKSRQFVAKESLLKTNPHEKLANGNYFALLRRRRSWPRIVVAPLLENNPVLQCNVWLYVLYFARIVVAKSD